MLKTARTAIRVAQQTQKGEQTKSSIFKVLSHTLLSLPHPLKTHTITHACLLFSKQILIDISESNIWPLHFSVAKFSPLGTNFTILTSRALTGCILVCVDTLQFSSFLSMPSAHCYMSPWYCTNKVQTSFCASSQ